MEPYTTNVNEAVDFLRSSIESVPSTCLILGTGLGILAHQIDVSRTFEYDSIPHFPVSTVESHHGKLLYGTLDGVPVLALQGRFHLYEGYDAQEVTFPVRVLALLGIRTLLVSNAAGGLNPHFRRGDLMLITDHINLQGCNPLAGPNNPEWGPRFPDMSAPYDSELQDWARRAALENGIALKEGVYVAVEGPNLETRAEYRFLRTIGADAVGMSTVPEVLVGVHMGLRIMAISVVTDECFPDALEPISLPAIFAAAAAAEPGLTTIMRRVTTALHDS